jgi:lipopolysaccharide export system protein LptA
MLAVGFVAFLAAYGVYAHFLGGIDGLPPLPADFDPGEPKEVQITPPTPTENNAKKQLRLAFGEDCPEKAWKIQLESQDKGFVLATDDVTVLSDGRVELSPFSFVAFRKENPDGRFPEINTIRSKKAVLSFDKPVTSITEIGGRKIVGGILGENGADDIYIVNNRRTPQRDDDISLYTRGPLYYEEARHQIWTMAEVKLTDLQSKPKPMMVTATGMDIYLLPTTKSANPQPASKKSNSGAPSNIERIVLRKDVDMILYVDARSNFLGAAKTPSTGNPSQARLSQPDSAQSARPGTPAQPQRAQVKILTQGPFEYDLRTKLAKFDIAKQGGPNPNLVKVDRSIDGKYDQLSCDHLELQLTLAKEKTSTPTGADDLEGTEIESVRATGKEVVLTSDAEILEAHGTDFFYAKAKQISILKGNPKMWALKEGNYIEAPELHMLNVKDSQQASAIGEGLIRLLDKKTGTRPLEAHWKSKLLYGKDAGQDLLTLFGDAGFVDHEHGQQLNADLLKVWLEPGDPNAPPNSDQPKRRPQRVEALGHVAAASTDMRVSDTETLDIYFRDPPAAELPLPTVSPGSQTPVPTYVASKPSTPSPSPPQTGQPTIPSLSNPLRTGPSDPTKPKRPIQLSARKVIAHVIRGVEHNDLDKLWCEGAVHVHQDPSSPEDKGVDIWGSQLDLAHHVEGNVLLVAGENARVQLNKIFILGPQINLDQTTNEAWVTGMGLMRMPSKQGFNTSDPKARETELIISWEKSMLFDGQLAKFRGGVFAEQESGQLRCQEMDVRLDRKMSFREGDKSDQPAKVQTLLCEKEVRIEDLVRQDTRLVSYKLMECFQLSLDRDNDGDESYVNASGPGRVRTFALGTKSELLPGLGPTPPQSPQSEKPKNKPATKNPQDDEEFKLTHVTYTGRLSANNKLGSATFWDDVEVLHVPTNNPDLKIDVDHPPEGYLFLRCNKLELFSHKRPEGRTSKEMRATGKVKIEAKEFSGHADEVKYDESKEQVILEGTEGNPAVLQREKVRGGERETIRAKKIFYWRTTGTCKIENGTSLIGNN